MVSRQVKEGPSFLLTFLMPDFFLLNLIFICPTFGQGSSLSSIGSIPPAGSHHVCFFFGRAKNISKLKYIHERIRRLRRGKLVDSLDINYISPDLAIIP